MYFMGMAEYERNPEKLMIIDDRGGAHYLYYESPAANRFDTCISNASGIACRRDVHNYLYLQDSYVVDERNKANFWIPNVDDRLKRVGLLPYNTIYTVILNSEWTEDYQRKEIQREAFIIQFK